MVALRVSAQQTPVNAPHGASIERAMARLAPSGGPRHIVARATPRRQCGRDYTLTFPFGFEGHFAAALAIVETAARAFEAVENEREVATVGAGICTLRHGVNALRTVYTEIDLAILGVPL